MRLSGMNIVVEEIPMTQDRYQDCISAFSERVAEKYIERVDELQEKSKQRKENNNG